MEDLCAFLCLFVAFEAKSSSPAKMFGKNRLARSARPGGHTLLHFLRCYVFLMSGNVPDVPKRIYQCTPSVTIKLVFNRPVLFGARGDGLIENRVNVFHIEQDTDR